MPAPTPRELQDRIRSLVEDAVEAEGYELVAVVVTTSGGRQALRVHIDRPGGVSIQDCSKVSRLLSPLLDVEDPIGGTYDLEVSSPGMERPVQRREDFERFEGYRAKFKLAPGHGRARCTGTLAGLDGDRVRVTTPGGLVEIPLEAIERAHLVLDLDEFRRIGGIDDMEGEAGPRGPEKE